MEPGFHFEGDGKTLEVFVGRFRGKDDECGFRYVQYSPPGSQIQRTEPQQRELD